MNTKRKILRFPLVVEVFCNAMALVARLTLPRSPVLNPFAAPRRFPPTRGGRTSVRRPIGMLALFLAVPLLAGFPAWAGQSPLPTGVPNIFDPEVRAKFQPVAVVNLRGNPDLPMLVLVNAVGEQPQAMALGLDARNGKDTWSLGSDPIFLIVLFADPSTILGVHVDVGFSREGKPSGEYMALDNPESLTLPDLLNAVTAAPTRTYM